MDYREFVLVDTRDLEKLREAVFDVSDELSRGGEVDSQLAVISDLMCAFSGTGMTPANETCAGVSRMAEGCRDGLGELQRKADFVHRGLLELTGAARRATRSPRSSVTPGQ